MSIILRELLVDVQDNRKRANNQQVLHRRDSEWTSSPQRHFLRQHRKLHEQIRKLGWQASVDS